MQHNCLFQPQNKTFFIVNKHYVDILNAYDTTGIIKGKDCAAALISYFEHRTNSITETLIEKKENVNYIPTEIERQIQVSLSFFENFHFNNTFSKPTILKSLELLVFCKFVNVERRVSEQRGKEKNSYVLNIEKINRAISLWIENNPTSRQNFYSGFKREPKSTSTDQNILFKNELNHVNILTTPCQKNDYPLVKKMTTPCQKNDINKDNINDSNKDKYKEELKENFANFQFPCSFPFSEKTDEEIENENIDAEQIFDAENENLNEDEIFEKEKNFAEKEKHFGRVVVGRKTKEVAQQIKIQKSEDRRQSLTPIAKEIIEYANFKLNINLSKIADGNLKLVVSALNTKYETESYTMEQLKKIIDNIFKYNETNRSQTFNGYGLLARHIFNPKQLSEKLELTFNHQVKNTSYGSNGRNNEIVCEINGSPRTAYSIQTTNEAVELLKGKRY